MNSKELRKNILKILVFNAFVVGCGPSDQSKESTKTTMDQEITLVDTKTEKIFAPGEHTVYVAEEIYFPYTTKKQIPFYEGYEYNKDMVIAIYSSTNNSVPSNQQKPIGYSNFLAYTYTNQVEVKVTGTVDNKGNVEYNNFGKPTEKGKEQLESEKQKTKSLKLDRH